jgi:predicted nucleic acid-binding protein
MNDKVFFDTNILVYLQSGMDPVKSAISRSWFEKHTEDNSLVLSSQVLQEFYVAMTRKLHHDPLKVKNIIILMQEFEVVNIQPMIIFEAIDLSILHRISFWDSLLLSSASIAQCSTLLSEDLNHGQVIRGVEVVNPYI